MSLRDVVNDAVTAAPSDTVPERAADALSSSGFGELTGDLLHTLLGHYATSAPMAQADLLAPIVTRTGVVPFDEEIDELPGAPLDAAGDDDLDPADLLDDDPDDPEGVLDDDPEGVLDDDPDDPDDPDVDDQDGPLGFGEGATTAETVDETDDHRSADPHEPNDGGAWPGHDDAVSHDVVELVGDHEPESDELDDLDADTLADDGFDDGFGDDIDV